MALVTVHAALRLLIEQLFQFGEQAAVRFLIIGSVLKNNVPLTVERDAVVWGRAGLRK